MIKRVATLFAVASVLASCSIGTKLDRNIFFQGKEPVQVCESYQGLTEDQAQAKINKDIYELQDNVERSLVFREKAEAVISKVDLYAESDKPFDPERIDRLSKNLQLEVDLMRPVMQTLASHKCWLHYEQYDVSDELKLKGLMVVLATTVSLYDDYITIFAALNENERLRRFVNHADSGYDRDEYLLEGMTEMFIEEETLSNVTRLIKRYHEREAKVKEYAQSDDNLMYLVQLVETSKSYPLLLKMDSYAAENYRHRVQENVTADTLSELGRSTVDALSGGFGNAIGSYEERKGLLYADKKLEEDVRSRLKIGDILLEKTPFRLTDSIIPGHWGHAAIWIGSEQELRNIGLWQHPLVVKYHEQIRRGELVAESLRTGATLSPLSSFLNVDDLGVFRSRPPLTDDDMRETIIIALRQIGKAYDFNFDVETTDKIVCSELVYLAYDKIKWPTESVVGRYTISPDNIAKKVFDNGPLELILFYHDGKRVENDRLGLLKKLMEQD